VLKAESYQLAVQAIVPKNSNGDSISLAHLKELVRRVLPPSSPARNVILAEKDFLPVFEALAKFEVFDRLLVKELDS
jgi:hypothetical protein